MKTCFVCSEVCVDTRNVGSGREICAQCYDWGQSLAEVAI